MGSAVAFGAAAAASEGYFGDRLSASDIVVVNRREEKTREIEAAGYGVRAVTGDYSDVRDADIVVVAVKPWDVAGVLADAGPFEGQVVVSVAAGIGLLALEGLCGLGAPVFNAIPNTAAAVRESMTFVTCMNATAEQKEMVLDLFGALGKVQLTDEAHLDAAMALCSCGTAFAMRYVRASVEGGVELGLRPAQALEGVLQTLKGAVALLEERGGHPEAEIDKVTTAGGLTIRGLNEMEHAGFTSSVIRGLKAAVGKD